MSAEQADLAAVHFLDGGTDAAGVGQVDPESLRPKTTSAPKRKNSAKMATYAGLGFISVIFVGVGFVIWWNSSSHGKSAEQQIQPLPVAGSFVPQQIGTAPTPQIQAQDAAHTVPVAAQLPPMQQEPAPPQANVPTSTVSQPTPVAQQPSAVVGQAQTASQPAATPVSQAVPPQQVATTLQPAPAASPATPQQTPAAIEPAKGGPKATAVPDMLHVAPPPAPPAGGTGAGIPASTSSKTTEQLPAEQILLALRDMRSEIREIRVMLDRNGIRPDKDAARSTTKLQEGQKATPSLKQTVTTPSEVPARGVYFTSIVNGRAFIESVSSDGAAARPNSVIVGDKVGKATVTKIDVAGRKIHLSDGTFIREME